MKTLRLILCLTVVALFSHANILLADSYDSETATIQKKSDHSAKVMIDKDTFTTGVCFKDGASWDNVKDHYEIDSGTAAALKSGKMCISVGANGTLSFMKSCCSNKCSKKKK